MSMVELAKVLRFSNLVRNVFGASPFFFDTEALKAKDIVRVTFLSTWPPLFLFVFCLIGLVLGSYLQYLSNLSHGNPSAVVDNDVMGVQFVEGSITMIIMQMTILSTLYTYIMAIIVTRLKRKNWCRFMVSILELVDKLDTRYQQKFDSIAVRNRLTIVMSTLLLYHFLFFIIFQWFIVPGMDSYYLIPICYTIESITASMTAVDILNSMIILGNIFNMLGEIPVNRKDEEFFGDYASAMDLIEAVGQNHGYREFFSIGNEFLSMLCQTFFLFYGIATSGYISWIGLFVGLGSIVPRLLKLLTLARVGDRVTTNVLKSLRKIQNEEVDSELLDNFSLHMHHYNQDIFITTKNCFPINFTMIFGIIGVGCNYFLVLLQFKDRETY